MEGVAQLAEHKVVALGVAGSSPVTLPSLPCTDNIDFNFQFIEK